MVICEYTEYKRGSGIMAKRGKSKLKGNSEVVNQIKIAVISSVICSLLAATVSSVFLLNRLQINFENMQNNVLEMKTNISSMSKDVDDIGDRVIKVETNITNISKLEERIGTIESAIILSAAKTLMPTENAMSSIGIEYGVSKLQYNLSEPKWKSIEVIAKDINTGKEYKAKDLMGEKILLPYKNGSQDVLFYGQFNENNLWDGNCIINVYERDQLVLIMDAVYDDGNLLEYQQVIPYTNNTDGDIWIISNRLRVGEANIGESWNYIRESEIVKSFDLNSASENNLINIELFKLRTDLHLIGYYHGNTSEGFYNDDTGNAYLVKYAEDGTVRTLYAGKFKNGKFHDDSGNAWYIAREEDTEYMYFKGVFKDGRAKEENKDVPFENPVYIERITEIIQSYTFKCELKWFDTRIIY